MERSKGSRENTYSKREEKKQRLREGAEEKEVWDLPVEDLVE